MTVVSYCPTLIGNVTSPKIGIVVPFAALSDCDDLEINSDGTNAAGRSEVSLPLSSKQSRCCEFMNAFRYVQCMSVFFEGTLAPFVYKAFSAGPCCRFCCSRDTVCFCCLG